MYEAGNTKPLGQQGKDLADTTAAKMQGGIQSTQHAANNVMDKASGKAEQLKSDAAPLLDKVSDQAQKLLQQGRERALQASDLAIDYAKEEPIKALLMAAAAGALMMGLVSLMARSRD
jgi:ElaB/YqjD/DUF883 family membrane-anchored ribosome-binding protein